MYESTMTLHRLGAAPTATAAHHVGLAWRAGTRVTEQSAGVAASLDTAADLPATVGQLGPRHRRVLQLSAEAEILPGKVLQHILTSRTTPSHIGLGAARPSNGALKVEQVVAVLARPGRLMRLDRLHAHQALQSALFDVANQFLPLR